MACQLSLVLNAHFSNQKLVFVLLLHAPVKWPVLRSWYLKPEYRSAV